MAPNAAPSVVASASQGTALDSVPFVNLLFAHIGGAAALFLATTDATLVATALPTIAENLHISPSHYTWVSVAYLLAQTTLQPVYGQLADKLGRKAVLVASIVVFMIGSALTAFATCTAVLLLARALAGAAAGGIVSSVWVILSEIVAPSKRAAWSMALSVTWCMSAVAGPVLGGVFTGSGHSFLSWRVAFLLNVPICIVALALVLVALRRFNFQERRGYLTWAALYRDVKSSFDFIGMVLLMGSTACVLLGFSRTASVGWTDRAAIVLVVVGVAGLVLAGIYEARTERDALIPPSLCRSLAASIVFLSSFLVTFAFNAGTFYLAVYAQARGASPLEAGYFILPYSLGSSAISIPTAIFIDRAQRGSIKTTMPPKVAFTVGLAVATVGFGLMTLLNVQTSAFERAFFPLVAGLGIGMTFHSPFQILTNAVGPEDLASTTGAFFLIRFIATTAGVSTGGVIFTTTLQRTLPSNYTVDDVMSNLNGLVNIPETLIRNAVLAAVARALSVIWMVCCPMVGLAFLAAMCIRVAPVRRSEDVAKPKRAETPDSTAPSVTETILTVDLEKGAPEGVVPIAPLATSTDESQ